MFDFPLATKVQRRMPKETFYRNVTMKSSVKDHFVSDVDKIVIEYSFTNRRLNLNKESKVLEIIVLSIVLKRKDFDEEILKLIAKQNKHSLIFLLSHGDAYMLAVFYDKKLYRTEWMKESEVSLQLVGYSLDEMWENIVAQIALGRKEVGETSLDDMLELKGQLQKAEREVKKLENAVENETQPKKKFELYDCLQHEKEDFEKLKEDYEKKI